MPGVQGVHRRRGHGRRGAGLGRDVRGTDVGMQDIAREAWSLG